MTNNTESKDQILLPIKFLEEYIQLLEESSWSPLYKLIIGNQAKALLKSAMNQKVKHEQETN